MPTFTPLCFDTIDSSLSRYGLTVLSVMFLSGTEDRRHEKKCFPETPKKSRQKCNAAIFSLKKRLASRNVVFSVCLINKCDIFLFESAIAFGIIFGLKGLACLFGVIKLPRRAKSHLKTSSLFIAAFNLRKEVTNQSLEVTLQCLN